MDRASFARSRAPGLLQRMLMLGLVVVVSAQPVRCAAQTVTIAVPVSRSGAAMTVGEPVLDAARLAVDEANAAGGTPRLAIEAFDDRSSDDGAREAARRIVAGEALVVVGPGLTTSSLAAGPVYASAGLASIVPHAHGDAVTANATTFRIVFSSSDMGEALGNYLALVLGAKRAVVMFRENGYGGPIAAGVRRAAERLGIEAGYRGFTTTAGAEAAAREIAAAPAAPAVVLAMSDANSVPVLAVLRRQGFAGPVLGESALGEESFPAFFRDLPEERTTPGFFTDGLYAVTPSMLDSANAETLLFTQRFRARFGREPIWAAVQAYDATRLAIAALRSIRPDAAVDLPARRRAVTDYLTALDSPAHALASLTGPLWFTPGRGRQQPIRVGRFHGTLFKSAPLQLVPASTHTAAELASGAVVQTGAATFARRQQVVYTGIFLNEIARVDIARSAFTADFYVWVRFAAGAGPGMSDPTDIDFPDLVHGSFDAHWPAAQGDLDDGTTYRLWRVRGDFKNDFDLHHYPYDRQTLELRLFNARAASDRIVYVRDRRSLAPDMDAADTPVLAGPQSGGADRGVAPTAFRNLTQWEALGFGERRDSLVTNPHSAIPAWSGSSAGASCPVTGSKWTSGGSPWPRSPKLSCRWGS